LRGYLPNSGKVSEPLFSVAKMSDFVVIDEQFKKPGRCTGSASTGFGARSSWC
jgi:hypothetical protein